MKLAKRIEALEAMFRADGASYTAWIEDGETDEQARMRAGIPDNAKNVVLLRWLSGALPAEKRGAIRWDAAH